jgi:hypothetical protein
MVTRTTAGWLAGATPLPTALRAVLGYYADTGVFDYSSLALKSTVDDRTEAMIADVFADVEAALAAAFDRDAVEFSYDTKLVLPAQLTLGYVYRNARRRSDADPVPEEIATGLPEVDEDSIGGVRLSPRAAVERAERMTRLAIRALIDGDMRDAINDAEFEDFAVDFPADADDRRRVAEIAQSTLEADLQAALDDLPDRVRETYDAAVEYSEAHQDRDPHFRELMLGAEDGDDDAVAAIRREYRDADLQDPPLDPLFGDLDLPYLKTQYARVGVLYDAMLELYRHAGLGIDEDFAKSIVLAIVGAQIWLDDVDDYADDRAEGQLTPVTAEYLLAEDEREAYGAVVDVTEEYLDLAKEYATRADSPLTGVAIEYIYRSGEPGVLPGTP